MVAYDAATSTFMREIKSIMITVFTIVVVNCYI